MAMVRTKNIQRSLNYLFLAVIAMLVSSCSVEASYNNSVDVHCEGWTPADTLFFEVQVVDSIGLGDSQKLLKGEKYDLALSFRYSRKYPYTTIPIHLSFDTLRYAVIPYTERPALTWSSLNQDIYDVPDIPISFSDTGKVVFTIIPDTILTEVYSVGLDIR